MDVPHSVQLSLLLGLCSVVYASFLLHIALPWRFLAFGAGLPAGPLIIGFLVSSSISLPERQVFTDEQLRAVATVWSIFSLSTPLFLPVALRGAFAFRVSLPLAAHARDCG